uniref:Uncharacterized protein n=1 Tax=Nelumbo nucifera TaxID=4432 RepID=A0A822ZRE7_NELNU|nr:TPA_asm: hypothetical protein HUJ06_004321 [Nelumbo nucifera]
MQKLVERVEDPQVRFAEYGNENSGGDLGLGLHIAWFRSQDRQIGLFFFGLLKCPQIN